MYIFLCSVPYNFYFCCRVHIEMTSDMFLQKLITEGISYRDYGNIHYVNLALMFLREKNIISYISSLVFMLAEK